MEPHIAAEETAAYIEGRLSVDSAADVEAHLEECAACRQEVAEVAGFIRGRNVRRRWLVAAPAAAAVLAGLLLFSPAGRAPTGPSTETLRGVESAAEREAVLSIDAVRPAEDEAVLAGSLAFVWRSLAPETVYRLTVTDEAGRPVWFWEGSDTTAAVPAADGLDPGRAYLWYVDALVPSGAEATSGLRRFATQP